MIGIYFLLNRRGNVIYIGQTTNFENRIKNHHIKKTRYRSYRFIPCAKEKLRHYETRWLNVFRPRLNKQIPCLGERVTLFFPTPVIRALRQRAEAEMRRQDKQIIHEVTAYGLAYTFHQPVGVPKADVLA